MTRSETLTFGLGSEIVGEFGGSSDDEFDLENTEVRLNYARRGATSAMNFLARYNEYNLDDTVVTSGPIFGIGTGTLVIDDGTAAFTRIDVGLETGIDQPFGFEVLAGYFNEDYTDTVDPDLIDNDGFYIDTTALFRIDPARTIRVLSGFSRETETSIDRDNVYVGAGLAAQTTGGLSFTGDLLLDRAKVGTVTNTGIGLELSVKQDRPNGAYELELSSRIDDSGRRTEASVSRSVTLPAGSLAFSLGIVDQEGDTALRPQASVAYERETRSGALTARLSQTPSVDRSEYYNNTDISVGYRDQINDISGWSAVLSYSAVNQLGGADDDDRATATISYTRTLAKDWEMSTGLSHVRESTDGFTTETSNTVFFNIQRDITFGF
ncbi:hypothetical protein [Silicimonas sp. MF1-12-2]|uniref:hypothetical protein n=1 Tax=Silicimonas sp. MF1-12-2 TaxID=3384793 RepID=UPI0039B47CA1